MRRKGWHKVEFVSDGQSVPDKVEYMRLIGGFKMLIWHAKERWHGAVYVYRYGSAKEFKVGKTIHGDTPEAIAKALEIIVSGKLMDMGSALAEQARGW